MRTMSFGDDRFGGGVIDVALEVECSIASFPRTVVDGAAVVYCELGWNRYTDGDNCVQSGSKPVAEGDVIESS